MHITGRTRVFLVIGDPVDQVVAPRLFNAVFRRHGVDAVLVPARVSAERVADFARAVLADGSVGGLWVTVPHKPALRALVDRCDAAAELAGACNAVRRAADGRLEGALFDGSGFVAALRRQKVALAGRRTLLVGTGGAGAAIAQALLQPALGLAELALHDRAPERAVRLAGRLTERLAARLAPHAGGATRVRAHGADPAGFDLVVHATPLGLHPDDPLPVDLDRLAPGATVVDILMKPDAPLVRACRARGITAHTGHEMLVQQVPDYLAFFGLHEAARAAREDLDAARAALGLADAEACPPADAGVPAVPG